ncbi:hypothetical protein M405DRAFT_934131 [Rhizopogon salebrosus TDB-379]|nr:hypothetical protein M405DRAFT_934131 [Rhizopogon salebrosus TDB-379]
MSESDTISICSAPPSYDTATQEPGDLEEEEYLSRSAMEASSVASQATLSTDTLVEPRMTLSSADAGARGPFTFSPSGTNAMLLLPHPLSPNSSPLYHISVSSDCFKPHIYTTTICRGGSDQGRIVAEIKQPLCQHTKYPGTVQVGPKMAYLANIHIRKGDCDAMRQRYDWQFHEGKFLRWETNCRDGKVTSIKCTRYGLKDAPVLASFRPIKRRGELQTLEVFPEGRPFMDDIVVSCLATESRRSTRYDK